MLFEYQNKTYPKYIKNGNAASFIFPFAAHFCKGNGLDIGGYLDSTLPDARPINILYNDHYNAYNLPKDRYDYIFSSHTLEHLPDYIKALEYWRDHLLIHGVLFLYLPHPEMEYWLPQRNRKHLHSFSPLGMVGILKNIGFNTVIYSERDLYWSFSVVGFL
jgi:hypothetical protein